MSELRWNRMLGQWIVTATHRQDRTFLPPAEYCPLCPTRSDEFATEVPASSYDIVLFENRFPSLQTPPPEAALQSAGLFTVAPAVGQCEVVLYTHEHNLTFAQLPQQRIENLISVWAERTEVLGGREGIEYVFVIEQDRAKRRVPARERTLPTMRSRWALRPFVSIRHGSSPSSRRQRANVA